MIQIRRQASPHDFVIDIAPLVDVLFTLLIFFSLTSSFLHESGIKINLPEASASGTVENVRRLEVVIPAEGPLRVNDVATDPGMLKELLGKIDTAEREGYVVIVKGDTAASHGKVTTVLDTVKGMGFKNIAIATRSKH
ncbi:MAG TPA: biopolymer transporter ExbD [bacterium]|nr:biopolymer transporter ExbD [bacterium]